MTDSDEQTYPVHLYIYDLSKGMARQLSPQLLGTSIEGVWHTSVIAHGKETFYGQGIQQTRPAETHHGYPEQVVEMGRTSIPPEIFEEYLNELRETYTADSYDLFDHNCNHMSNEVCEFLVGKGIPDHITSLPHTVLQTPFGQMLRPMIDQAFRPVVQYSGP